MTRQPVHTVYGGAHLFRAETAKKLAGLALAALDRDAPDVATFGSVFGLDAPLAETVRARVAAKLADVAVEDLRIDFEDGYGPRSDDEEDRRATEVGAELARGLAGGSLPPFIGVRVKGLGEETAARSLRTLDLVVRSLVKEASRVPSPFVVTLPKVESEAEVATLARALADLERELSLPASALSFEIMVETPRALVDERGALALGRLVSAGEGRCVAAHFGAYDYTASLGVSAEDQTLGHPACDLARQLMLLALAGTSVAVSDGATNVLPIGTREVVHDAWKLHAADVRRGLSQGFYQGWDLHPAQLVSRYAALYLFFRRGLQAATARLAAFVERAAQASRVGAYFDDAASAQGLLNFFLRGVSCGALDEADVTSAGLTMDELRARSFAEIGARRSAVSPP